MAACDAHPLGADSGATCTREDVHGRAHVYVSAWLADRHDSEVEQ